MTGLDAERWRAVKAILADALSLEPERRDEFVRSASRGDTSLARQVGELLALEGGEAERLENPVIDAYFKESSIVGQTIGKYAIVEELGSGGMGSVYLAERDEGTFTQRVALKLIRQGFANKEVLARFINERQILASLQHVNIAHLIDGGTTDDGHPYLVMEYIEGLPITEYVEANRADLKQRLRLFLQICSAVAYAHQKLIIHRDLKPTNILVTPAGIPKLLDFGIAKILGDGPAPGLTATRRFVFTPEYASPEQVCGENLTTATDIYSLGVILYELLTGQRPYATDKENITRIVKIVCESNPSAPSKIKTGSLGSSDVASPTTQFRSLLRGDLDSITLKALRKEPDRRYSSATALADDIKCYLDGKPVDARSGTWRYRASKFIRRHRISVAAGTLVVLALVGGLVATLYQASIAQLERSRAEKRFNDVRQLANSFVFEINDEIDKSPIKARALVVERAIEYLDKLAVESGGDDSLVAELASAYEKIGDVQSELFRPNLGNAGGALESQRKALELRQQLHARGPADIDRALALANSHLKVGGLLTVTGDIQAAADNYRRAAEICEAATRDHPGDLNIQKTLATSYVLLGQATLRSGSLAESLDRYKTAYRIYEQIVRSDPSPASMRRLSVVHSYIGWVEVLTGDTQTANADFEHSLDIERQILSTDPQNTRYKENVGVALLWAGIGYRESGRLDDSLELIRQAIAIQEEQLKADPLNFGEQNSMADCLMELGIVLEKRSEYATSEEAFRRAEKYYMAVHENDVNDLSAWAQMQLARRLRADVLFERHRYVEAAHLYDEALNVLTDLAQRDPRNLDWRFEQALCLAGKGKVARSLREFEGREHLETAQKLLQGLTGISPTNIRYQQSLAEIDKALAK